MYCFNFLQNTSIRLDLSMSIILINYGYLAKIKTIIRPLLYCIVDCYTTMGSIRIVLHVFLNLLSMCWYLSMVISLIMTLQWRISCLTGSWVGFVQAMSSLGLFFYFISTGTGFLQFYWEYRKKRRLLYGSAVTGLLAGQRNWVLLDMIAWSENIIVV